MNEHSNDPCKPRLLTVDRKFHIGMLRYADLVHSPIVTVNPPLQDGEMIMDAIEVPTRRYPIDGADGIARTD